MKSPDMMYVKRLRVTPNEVGNAPTLLWYTSEKDDVRSLQSNHLLEEFD